ncbi:MAG: group III truncated hemoglobin [Flavobacteriales bacterium]
MKRELKSIDDIRLLVDSFYSEVSKDEDLNYIFNVIHKVDWVHHLPQMYKFWSMILFGRTEYNGNPMLKHILVNKKTPLTTYHFDKWLALWFKTVDTYFIGENAMIIKLKAENMSRGIRKNLSIKF